MDSEISAYSAAQNRHHHYMVFGKKHRYIEVFQCSGEDMNLVLSGGGVPAQRAVVSPGMLMWDQSAATLSCTVTQGSSTPAVVQSPSVYPTTITRPIPPASILPPAAFPSSYPVIPSGTLIPGLVAPQLKQDSVLVSNTMLPPQTVRPTFIQPSSIDIQTLTQNHPSLVPNVKPVLPSASVAPAVFTGYNDGSLMASGFPSGMVVIPGSKLPVPMYAHAVPPQVPLIAVSSSHDFSKPAATYTSKQSSFSSLLPVPFNSTQPGIVAGGLRPLASPAVSSSSKRSFDQAFVGDKNIAVRPFKRPPPKLPASPVAAATAATYGLPRLSHPQAAGFHLASASAQSPLTNPGTLPAANPMIPGAFYSPPHLYPPPF